MPSDVAAAPAPAAFPAVELGPSEPVEIAAPPVRAELERSWLTTLLPALSVLGMVAFAVFAASPLLIALSGGVAVLSIAGALAVVRVQRRRAERAWAERCRRYREHLERAGRTLDAAARRQAAADAAAATAPRRPGDAGFLTVRLGRGRLAARRPPRAQPAAPDADVDAELGAAADALAGRFGAVDALGITLDLRPGTRTVLIGPQLGLLRALVCQVAATHSSHDLTLHSCVPAAEDAWLRRLPHHRGEAGGRSAGAVARLVVLAGDPLLVRREWAGTASPAPRPGHPVAGDPPPALLAVWPADTEPPADATAVVAPAPEGVPGVLLTRLGAEPVTRLVPRPERISHAEAVQRAAALAATAPRRRTAPPADFTALSERVGLHGLRLPLGVGDDGPLVLDLAEPAAGGDGPHGLVIGSTGSGKSELLRTLVLAAAGSLRPDQLAILLVDYKGGAAFGDLAALPHLAGLVTNLADDPLGAERLATALRAESRRRQEALRAAGAPDVATIERRRRDGERLPPLPRLLVVVDEYAELLEQSPEALEALTSLGRVGRSLGVHMVLSSQRLDDGKLRGLEAHLRYRICLRTLNAGDSQSMLGSRAAVELPAEPGWAWLNRDAELIRWRAMRAGPDALDAACRRAGGARARPIIAQPLPERLCLTDVDGCTEAEGRDGRQEPADGLAALPVGLSDLPEQARRGVLRADLRRPLAVVGAPGSGRSTLLTTTVLGAAAAIGPAELAVHLVTAAGSPLCGLSGLPHVGTVATDPHLAEVVVRALGGVLDDRQSGASGSDVLLVVDDVGRLLRAQESLLPLLLHIATAGPAHGVRLLMAAGRWSDLRGGLREACAGRWELTVGDPAESEHPQLVRRIGRRSPGRLLTGSGVWAQAALPHRCSSAPGAPCGAGAAPSALVTALARRGGPPTPAMQPLPPRVPAAGLPPPVPGRLWLGVAGPYTAPVAVPVSAGEHLLVLGNSGSGRSGLLRALIGQLDRLGDRRLWVVDPRRRLSGVGDPVSYAGSQQEVTALVERLAAGPGVPSGAGSPHRGDVLVVDDLELAAGRSSAGAWAALAEALPYAAEQGLSVIASRRASGSVRAGFDPFYGRLLELCETGLILSGDPAEGPLLGGVRPDVRPAGRGQLVRRGEPAGLLQAAWAEPVTDVTPGPLFAEGGHRHSDTPKSGITPT